MTVSLLKSSFRVRSRLVNLADIVRLIRKKHGKTVDKMCYFFDKCRHSFTLFSGFFLTHLDDFCQNWTDLDFMPHTTFADLFHNFLIAEGLKDKFLEGLCRKVSIVEKNGKTYEEGPSCSKYFLGKFRRGEMTPTRAQWKIIESALISYGSKPPTILTERLEELWNSYVPISEDLANTSLSTRANQDTVDQIESILKQSLQNGDPAEIEKILCRTSAIIGAMNESISIPGGESGYFDKWLEVARQTPKEKEIAFAYIRPFNASKDLDFEGFYEEVRQLCEAGKLDLYYIFLDQPEEENGKEEDGESPNFQPPERFAKVKGFAEEIRIAPPGKFGIGAPCLRPSFVLMTTQKKVFTHERDDAHRVVDAQLWKTPEAYDFFEKRWNTIRRSSRVLHKKSRS